MRLPAMRCTLAAVRRCLTRCQDDLGRTVRRCRAGQAQCLPAVQALDQAVRQMQSGELLPAAVELGVTQLVEQPRGAVRPAPVPVPARQGADAAAARASCQASWGSAPQAAAGQPQRGAPHPSPSACAPGA